MGFISKDEIEQFSFSDAVLHDLKIKERELEFKLDALIVKERNSQNSNFTQSFADTVQVVLQDARIEKVTLSGYRVYDANDNLLEEIPDRVIDEKEWENCLKNLEEVFLYNMILVEKTSDRYVYDMETEPNLDAVDYDLKEDSYIIRVSFSHSIFSWERYMNRVQN